MSNDVNKPDGSSPEEQRKNSVSHTEDDSQLDGSLQTLAEKPGVSDIVNRLMNPDDADDGDTELENHNEDEEGKETDPDADSDEEKDPPADEDADDEDADESADGDKPKAKATVKADPDGEAIVEGDEPKDDADEKPPAKVVDDTEHDDGQFGHGANKRIRQLLARDKAKDARIAELEAQVADLGDKASYRDTLEKTLNDHKVDTKTWDEWTKLGLLMQADPVRAARTLGTMAKALGYQDPDGPIAKLDDDLEVLVKDQEMTKEAAEKMQRQRLKQMPVAAPRPRQADPAAPPADDRSPSLPRLTRDDQAVGAKAIAAVDAEFRKKYPDQWTKLAPEVQAEMAKYKGTPPHLWGQIARDCAEKVVAKRTAKAPTSSRPDPSMRATGGSSRTVTRNNTGPATSKSELADRIASGTAGKGPIRR